MVKWEDFESETIIFLKTYIIISFTKSFTSFKFHFNIVFLTSNSIHPKSGIFLNETTKNYIKLFKN